MTGPQPRIMTMAEVGHLYSRPVEIRRDISLRPYNTFGLDVAASALAEVLNADDLLELLDYSRKSHLPLLTLGGGSNVLFTKNVDALVILNRIGGIEVVSECVDEITVKAGAGVIWHNLVSYCVKEGWGGIENLSLIPGMVGAAPMQNIGAYGVELREVFAELEAIHIDEGHSRTFSKDDCAFGYRESVFKRELKGQYIISSVTLRLSKQPKVNTSYGAIAQELERMGVTEPSISDVSHAVVNIRRSKLPDPSVLGNAGSFFKNPVVPTDLADRIRSVHPTLPSYPADGGTKLAAGWLIEQCGWKGKVVGSTGSHRDQALVLVNYGNATGVEVFNLSEAIMSSVKDTFGVDLEREVNIY